MDVHPHAPVLPQGAIVGAGVWCPFAVQAVPASILAIQPLESPHPLPKASSARFGGKYKKPSSGHLEGEGLGSKV